MDLLSPHILLLLLLLGASAGFLAGLLGVGGGVILVPLFLWLFSLAQLPESLIVHTAFGTSLAIIVPTALSSTLGHRKHGNVDWHMVAYLALGGICGALAGGSVAAYLPGERLKICFGFMQILVSLKLLFFQPELPAKRTDYPWRVSLLAVGIAGGFFSAFFGVGGGVVSVPLMLITLRLPIHLAVGNSSALIVISSLFGAMSYVWHGLRQPLAVPGSIGYVNILVAGMVAPLTVLCARFGARQASKTSQEKLLRVFAVLLLIVGVKILVN